jgi:hypothetical protein
VNARDLFYFDYNKRCELKNVRTNIVWIFERQAERAIRTLNILLGPRGPATELSGEKQIEAMSLSLLKFAGQASLVDEAMLPS